MGFFGDCDSDADSQSQSESEVSSTLAAIFARKCDFFQFQDGRNKSRESHDRSEFIRLIPTE